MKQDKVIKSKKAFGKWFCKQCGQPMDSGFFWNGKCIVCAEPDLIKEFGSCED